MNRVRRLKRALYKCGKRKGQERAAREERTKFVRIIQRLDDRLYYEAALGRAQFMTPIWKDLDPDLYENLEVGKKYLFIIERSKKIGGRESDIVQAIECESRFQ